MNYYETLYIVHPALDAGRLKDIITGVDDSLKKMGGNPLAVELWGKRKLAYFIDKQKYGTYVLVQYNGEGKCTSNFAVELEHNPNILAYLTTSIEKDKVIEQEEDIETQIAGKTREAERSEARKGKEVVVVETDIKEGDKSPEDESEQTDSSTEERDADSTEIKAETTESEDKENDSTEDETPEESSDSEADKDVDTPEENSDAQVTDEESSAEIAESESDEENTTSEELTEKESETKQEKAEDEPAAVSEEEK